MRIVIDTSMIFSILLAKSSKMRDIFFDPAHTFHAPNYIIGELFEKKEKIMKCSSLSEVDLYELLHRILNGITFVSEDFVSSSAKHRAFKLCEAVDEKDTPFIALSLQLQALFWTGDKRLKNHLKQRGVDLFFKPDAAVE
jgi:predicted nucleic acid-binding protein